MSDRSSVKKSDIPSLRPAPIFLRLLVRFADCAWRVPWLGEILLSLGYRISRRSPRMGPVHLSRLDGRDIPPGPREIRLFAAVRNHADLMPAFFRHYASLGVDRYFVVDNESTDDTVSILLSHPNVHTYQIGEKLSESHSGMDWIHLLMRDHGVGRWCVIVDADEFMVYPHHEVLTLRGLTTLMEKASVNAMYCLLLDMYSDGPLASVQYSPGDDIRDAFPYFDRAAHILRRGSNQRLSNAPDHVGGARARVFGEAGICLNKVPLVKYHPRISLASGHHHAVGARLSEVRGALLHYKFGPWFMRELTNASRVTERKKTAHEYESYVRRLAESPDLSLIYPGSERLRNSQHLVDLGIMRTSQALEEGRRRDRLEAGG